MDKIEIKRFTPDLIADFFDFFDLRAFSDHEEWSCCYCTFFHSDNESEEEIEEWMKANGNDVNALRQVSKNHAQQLIVTGVMQGYIAYSEGKSVAWCNFNDKRAFSRLDFDTETSNLLSQETENIKAVTCFTVSPEYRSQGIATALLERAISDATAQGISAIEGYARFHETRFPFDYTGPIRLYEKLGFVQVAKYGKVAVMRKELGSHL
jgi:GNAT superfamily N-acetyltransferase